MTFILTDNRQRDLNGLTGAGKSILLFSFLQNATKGKGSERKRLTKGRVTLFSGFGQYSIKLKSQCHVVVLLNLQRHLQHCIESK